jgi:hypothetical protein
MDDLQQRLAKGAALLADLDQKRRDTRTPQWGYDTEYLIISQELRQLEIDILEDPGALESQLVRVRRKPRAQGDPRKAE